MVTGALTRFGGAKSPHAGAAEWFRVVVLRPGGTALEDHLTRVTRYGVLVLETADRDVGARTCVPAL